MLPPVLVGSYPAVSPITCARGNCVRGRPSHRLVYSLLHLSSGHPAWPLASPLPFGVRTFLSRLKPRPGLSLGSPATVQPTPKNRCKYSMAGVRGRESGVQGVQDAEFRVRVPSSEFRV